MNLNDHLFELEFQIEKHRGTAEADFLTRRGVMRSALIKWGDSRYQDGYGDGRRDVFDARTMAKEHEAATETEEEEDGG